MYSNSRSLRTQSRFAALGGCGWWIPRRLKRHQYGSVYLLRDGMQRNIRTWTEHKDKDEWNIAKVSQCQHVNVAHKRRYCVSQQVTLCLKQGVGDHFPGNVKFHDNAPTLGGFLALVPTTNKNNHPLCSKASNAKLPLNHLPGLDFFADISLTAVNNSPTFPGFAEK